VVGFFKMEKSISFESNWFKDIVLETDSPYLAPVPFRGRNESSYLLNVIDKLAIIYNLTAKETITTTENSKAIFGI
jgi:TatD DNase family protein